MIIRLQSCGFRYNRTLNICFAKTTHESLTLCYYNIWDLNLTLCTQISSKLKIFSINGHITRPHTHAHEARHGGGIHVAHGEALAAEGEVPTGEEHDAGRPEAAAEARAVRRCP